MPDPDDKCARCRHIRMHHYHMFYHECQYEVVKGTFCDCPAFEESDDE